MTTLNEVQIQAAAALATLPAGTTYNEAMYIMASNIVVRGSRSVPAATLVMFGDSRTANAWAQTGPITKSTALDWFEWGQALTTGGRRFDVIANKGTAGDTTTQMAARFAADVLALNPDAMTIWGGTNDAWSTTADVDATYLRMVTMMDLARSAGIYIFLVSETVANTKTAAFPPLVFYYNEKLREYAFVHRGVTFLDFNSQIVDPLSATAYPAIGTTYDGLHPSINGAYLCGKNVVAPALAGFPPRGQALLNSICDNQTYNAASANVLDVGMFQGSGGSKAGGHTGTLATGWTSSGTATAVLSTPARSDGCGNNQRAVITAASSSDGLTLSLNLAQARFVAGGVYVIEGEMTISAATALLRADLIFGVTAPTTYAGGVMCQVNSNGTFPAAAGPLTLRSPEWTAPSSPTGASLQLVTAFTGAGGATVDWGRLSVKRVA